MRSHKSINYNLRVAKSIERRMLAEVFQRLNAFSKPTDQMYIGMGSIYFTDFILFRRLCGFNSMLSFEHPDSTFDEPRFQFNKPFDEIQFTIETSSAMISRRPWIAQSKTPLIWLDYDNIFDRGVIDDLTAAVSCLPSGAFLGVSYQIDFENRGADSESAATESSSDGQINQHRETKLDRLIQLVGDEHVPHGTKEGDLTKKNLPKLLQRIAGSAVEKALSDINAGKPLDHPNRKMAKQVVHFRYADGAPMATIGYVIHEAHEEPSFTRCCFDEMTFYSNGEAPYSIEPPLVTPLEARLIDHASPIAKIGKKNGMWPLHREDIPVSDKLIRAHRELSRYFPPFAQVEI